MSTVYVLAYLLAAVLFILGLRQLSSPKGARNVANLLLHLVKDGAINLDFTDEITKGACVTHAGEIVSERAKQLLAAAS